MSPVPDSNRVRTPRSQPRRQIEANPGNTSIVSVCTAYIWIRECLALSSVDAARDLGTNHYTTRLLSMDFLLKT